MDKEYNKDNSFIENTSKEESKNRNYHKTKDDFKKKECKVIAYNISTKSLDVKFDNYGIRIKNVESFDNTDTITVKYKGEIGKSNFIAKV